MGKIVKNIGIAFLAVVGTVGCTLTEKIDIETNIRPMLLIEFPEGEEIETLHVLAYSPEGIFLDSLQLVNPALTKAVHSTQGGPDTLMVGVPEGEYRVVCYANLEQSYLTTLKKDSTSMFNELAVLLDPTPEYDCTDPLYHGLTTAVLRRGKPAVVRPELVPRYYDVELTLQKDEDDTTSVQNYSVRLVSVPDAVDGEGAVKVSGEGHTCCFTPELATDVANGRRTAEFLMNRFGDDHGVKLVLYKAGVEIARVPVLPSVCGVDPQNPARVVLPIYIEVAIDKILISIQDWNTIIVQNTGVGA